MRKTQKQILGLFGLGVVIAMTAVAVALPGPKASAASTLTDHITVRVVGDVPDVNASGIEPGSEFVDSEQTIRITYENVRSVKAVLKRTDLDGNEHIIELVDELVDYEAGELVLNIDFSNPQYGYGDYVLTVTGDGLDGHTDEDIIEFSYQPFTAELEESDDSNDSYVDLDYTPDDGMGDGENSVTEFLVEIFDEDGNLISPLSPIAVPSPETRVEIPFDDYDLAPGRYTIKITAYNRNKGILSIKYLYKIIEDEGEDIPVPDTSAPDTGGLFKNLNISQADFLITGLSLFLVVGIGGIIFISKRDKKSSRRR